MESFQENQESVGIGEISKKSAGGARARRRRFAIPAAFASSLGLLVTYMPLACVVGRAHDASSKGKTRPLSSKDTSASSHPALEIIALACSLALRLKALCFSCSQKDEHRQYINGRAALLARQKKSHTTRAGEQSSPQVTVQSPHASRSDGSRTAAHSQHSQCPQPQQPPRRRRPEAKDRRQHARRPRPHRDRHHKTRRTAHRGA